MPSRISRDLRTSAAFGTSPNDLSSSSLGLDLSPGPMATKSRPVSQDYSAPIVKGSDGALLKVCGSLVEPSAAATSGLVPTALLSLHVIRRFMLLPPPCSLTMELTTAETAMRNGTA